MIVVPEMLHQLINAIAGTITMTNVLAISLAQIIVLRQETILVINVSSLKLPKVMYVVQVDSKQMMFDIQEKRQMTIVPRLRVRLEKIMINVLGGLETVALQLVHRRRMTSVQKVG